MLGEITFSNKECTQYYEIRIFAAKYINLAKFKIAFFDVADMRLSNLYRLGQ